MEKEKKESIQKVQTMHNEIRDLKSKLQEYECGKSANVKKLEDSLTEALKSNKRVQDNLEKEKQLANNRYHANTKLMEEMGELRKEKSRVETEHKSLQSLLEKKKAAEMELETMVKDLKDKLGKFDGDKKSAMKMEKGLATTISGF